jgi:hypothetical protein
MTHPTGDAKTMRYKDLGRRYGRFRLAGLGAVLVLGVGACNTDKLINVNENPNNPQSAPPQAVFTYASRVAMQRWFGSNPVNQRGTVLTAQHLAQNQYPDEDRYARLDAEVTDASFINAYALELKNFQSVVVAGKADDVPLLWGPAQIMRSLIFGYVTDVWGDVPYSEALQGDVPGGTIVPAYDPQEDIYNDLFVQLSEAVTAIAGAPAGSPTLGAADPFYSGNSLRWQRFGNSLRARHAMRLANVDAAKAQAELNAAIAAPGGLIASNADNARIPWPGDGVYNNPWSVNGQGRDDHRMSDRLMNEMVPRNDPRTGIYAQPTTCFSVPATAGCPAGSPQYAGMPNALTASDAQLYTNTSSRPGKVFFSTTRFCPGCSPLTGASFPNVVLSYAEVSFIQAEAAERGWIAGSAAAFYVQGIQASMAQWGVTDAAAIAAYIAQPGVAYTPGAAGLRQIALQKWIGLYTDGVSAWAEWRRTCVPATVVPGPDAIINTVPRRYQYSIRERSVNSANLDEAVARQGADEFTTRMYWDTAPQNAPTWPGASCGVRP